MSHTPFRLARRSFCSLLLAAAAPAAFAAFPDKPLKIIVPAPAGGVLDIVARVIGDQMAAELGQPVVIDNKPGAGGSLGVNALRSAPADGYTILMSTSGMFTEVPHVLKVSFDPMKDIVPLASVTRSGMVLVGAPNVPANNLKELLAYVKANTGKLSIATYSPGTVGHYACAQLNQRAGLDLAFVPFAGAAPALTQVMGGQIALMFDAWATSKPMIESGRVKAFGVPGKVRSPQLPNVPTFAEQGFGDLVDPFYNWHALVVQPGVPKEIAARLRAAVLAAAAKPGVRERLMGAGVEVYPDPGVQELQRSLREDYKHYGDIVTKFNIKLNS